MKRHETTCQTARMPQSRFRDRTEEVGISKMSYVGLLLALAFAEKRFSVLGFEVEPAKGMLARGHSYLRHVVADRAATAGADGGCRRRLIVAGGATWTLG